MENSQKNYVPAVLVFLAFFAIVLTSLFYFHFFSPTQVEASATDNLSGYAWSENIGWISFNCTDTGTCATSPYGVTVSATGALSGYAWSENIGWVSFNASDVTSCPSGTCPPTFDKVTGNVTGWARAIAPMGANASNAGGWDGFVSLSGSNYGITVSGCAWGGWAWGSDVVGWISFGGNGGGTVTGTGNACKGNPPTLTFGANPTSVYAGATSTLTWTVTGTADSCWASGAWTGWKAYGVGPHTEVVTVGPSTATYSIECWNSGASSGIQNAVVTVTAAPAPGLTLSASPTTINLGGTSTLSWVVSGSADSCIATGAWSGNKSPTAGSYQLNVSPIINSIYNLECSYKGSSSGIKTATVNIAASCPAGVMNWSVGTDNCTGTIVLTNSGANGSITDSTAPTTGSATYVCTNGTWAGSPNAGATCSSLPNLISAMIPNANGALKKGDIVTFSGRVLNSGSASVNTQFSDNFTYCWGAGCAPSLMIGSHLTKTVPINPGGFQDDTSIGFTLSQSGTLRVQHCVDSRGQINNEGNESDNCSIATLTVVPPPTGTITAIPAGPYDSGGSSKITWSANDATSCEVQVAGVAKWTGITNTTSGGEPTGVLYVPTRYDLMCKNALFTSFVLVATANVTVTYIPELNATRKLVNDGGTTTLIWDTNNGNEASCTLNNGTGDLITANIGDFSTGSVVVTINGRTTYKLTCPIPPSGSESDSVTIEVVPKGYET